MKYRENFDDKEYLLTEKTKETQAIYHTKMANAVVHVIKDSSAYAATLILHDKNYEMGQKIFEKVISLQDINPHSPTYGCWPYYMEETLEEMDAPDFNMAGFNAKEMIAVIKKAGQHLDADVKKLMNTSIERACRCIIKRNVSVVYTNVCITDSFITIAAGEMLGLEEFIEYGRKKLENFYFYTKAHGDIAEYNSPCYSPLAINDIADFFEYVSDEESLECAKKVNKILWRMMAEHFDYDTLQLNGPQERAYSDYLGVSVLKTFGKGTGVDYTKHPKFEKYFSDKDKEIYLIDSRTKPICPEEYIPYFNGKKRFSEVLRRVTDGFNYPYFEFAKVATTYKSENYAIGTMNRSEMWNQRRPLLGYIKTDEKDVCFRVRCLHDGYDFSSGAFHSVQNKSEILASINFSEKRGDTHVSLDMLEDGILSVEELKVVFEFSGSIEKIKTEVTENGLVTNVNGVYVRITPFVSAFGEENIAKEIEVTDDKLQYSIILYKGERKNIDLLKLKKAIVAFTVEFMPVEEYIKPIYTENDDFLEIRWKTRTAELGLKSPQKTLAFYRNMSEDMQTVNGVDLVSLASK